MSASKFRHLLSPIQVGHLKLRNRFMVAPHGTALADKDHLPTEEMVAYLEERARGGAALIVMGGSFVMKNSVSSLFRNLMTDRRGLSGYRRIAERVHAHGAYVLAQLSHVGRQGRSLMNMQPLWSPSPLPDVRAREVPKEMEPEDFETLIEHFVLAAQLVQDAGFDGGEIYAAQGYLLSSILSPHTNIRADAFGGSLENRMHFIIELITRVRRAVGREFCIGFRMNGDDFTEGGLSHEQCLQVAKTVASTGLVDYLHVSGGTNHSRNLWIADMTNPPGVLVPYAASIKEAVNIPVAAVCRIVDPAQAEAVLAQGQADLIAMVRALVADPYLPHKTAAGRVDDIRLCISCNQGCEHRAAGLAFRIGCIYNPTAGQEWELGLDTFRKAETARTVLVIGGGPAGMEAARTAALRGHQVTLLEKSHRLGGQIPLFADAVPSCAGFQEIPRYFSRQLDKLGVNIRFGVTATPDLVLQEGADVVIIATGSEPDRSGYNPALPAQMQLPGVEQDNVLTAWDVLGGTRPVGKRVVLYDEQSSLYTASVAEFLAAAGREVIILTRLPQFGLEIPRANLGPQLKRLFGMGVEFHTYTLITKVDGRTLHTAHAVTREVGAMENVDTLVLCLYHRAVNGLYKALKGQVAELYAVGDCVSPRGIQQAIENAHRLARAV